jgi:hypothetical protein
MKNIKKQNAAGGMPKVQTPALRKKLQQLLLT